MTVDLYGRCQEWETAGNFISVLTRVHARACTHTQSPIRHGWKEIISREKQTHLDILCELMGNRCFVQISLHSFLFLLWWFKECSHIFLTVSLNGQDQSFSLWVTSDQQNTRWRWLWGTFETRSLKRYCGILQALSWVACLRGSLLLCCEDPQAALWRGPRGEELSPPAKSHVSAPSWMWTLQPESNFQMTAASRETLSRNPLESSALGFLPLTHYLRQMLFEGAKFGGNLLCSNSYSCPFRSLSASHFLFAFLLLSPFPLQLDPFSPAHFPLSYSSHSKE